MFGLISLCNHSLIFPDVCVPLLGALLSQAARVLYAFWSLLKLSSRAPRPGLTLGVSPSLADAAEPSRDPAGFLPQRPAAWALLEEVCVPRQASAMVSLLKCCPSQYFQSVL